MYVSCAALWKAQASDRYRYFVYRNISYPWIFQWSQRDQLVHGMNGDIYVFPSDCLSSPWAKNNFIWAWYIYIHFPVLWEGREQKPAICMSASLAPPRTTVALKCFKCAPCWWILAPAWSLTVIPKLVHASWKPLQKSIAENKGISVSEYSHSPLPAQLQAKSPQKAAKQRPHGQSWRDPLSTDDPPPRLLQNINLAQT